jgi:hypothetical protein
MKMSIPLATPEKDMPEAVPAAVLFDHLDDLEFPAEESQDIAPRETSAIGSQRDVPVPMAAAEHGKNRAEYRKDKNAAGRQNAQNTGLIGQPVRLFLMMEAAVVQDNVEWDFWGRQTEDIRCSKSNPPETLLSGKAPGALDGQGLIINSCNVETQPGRRDGVAAFAATDIQ